MHNIPNDVRLWKARIVSTLLYVRVYRKTWAIQITATRPAVQFG